MPGKLQKMKIIAYKDDAFKSKAGEFEVQVNPTTYKENWTIEYGEEQATGASGNPGRFKRIPPQTYDFELIFDGTGALGTDAKAKADVSGQIEKLLDLVAAYDGDIHRPRFCEVVWGTLNFQGRLTSANVTYELFKPDGSPLRAKVQVGFSSSINDKKRAQAQADSSPDMTHHLKAEDSKNLPAMTQKIYGDFRYYIYVAAYNDLPRFTVLKPGSTISFPPLEKLKSLYNLP